MLIGTWAGEVFNSTRGGVELTERVRVGVMYYLQSAMPAAIINNNR